MRYASIRRSDVPEDSSLRPGVLTRRVSIMAHNNAFEPMPAARGAVCATCDILGTHAAGPLASLGAGELRNVALRE